MKLSFKKVVGVILAVLMLASSMSAFACANDVFLGYDQIPDFQTGRYNKLYMCPEVDEVIINGTAKEVEWVPAFYEAEYPHLRVDVLVLDGTDTGFTKYATEWSDEKNGVVNIYADVNTKEVPAFWEVKLPHFVYNRIYSDFTGEFEPTTVLKTEYVTAPVERDWVKKGFDKYVIEEDGTVVDYSHMYGTFDSKINFEWNVIDDLYGFEKDAGGKTQFPTDVNKWINSYWGNVIKGVDARGKMIYTEDFMNGKAYAAYDMFEHAINNVSWLQLTGPDYVTGGERVVTPFQEIVDDYLTYVINPEKLNWSDNLLVTDNDETVGSRCNIPQTEEDHIMHHLGQTFEDKHATIEWKTIGYECVAPYRYYQVLTINGVPMNGSVVDIKNYKVEKEEVTDVFPEMPDRIQLVEKESELAAYDYDERFDYVVTPYTADVARKYSETLSYKVIEDYTKEKVLKEMDTDYDNPARELRFVKVTLEDGQTTLPYIWRYTGGFANPEIKWMYAFTEKARPYENYEEKWVKDMDGNWVPTGEIRSMHTFANDVPTISTEMSQPRVLTVMLDNSVNTDALSVELKDAGYKFIIAGQRVHVYIPEDLPAELYDGNINTIIEMDVNRIIRDCSVREDIDIEWVD